MDTQAKTTVEWAQEPRVSPVGMRELGILFAAYTDSALPYWFSPLYDTVQEDDFLRRETKDGQSFPVKYSGKIAKRLAQFAKNRYDVKLSPEQVQTLGDCAARHRVSAEQIIYDITDRFDWHSGDFGDNGSCYWGDRAAARPAMENAGCLALRFYDSMGGIARCWVAPIADGVVLFNAYARKDCWVSQNGSTLAAMATFLQSQHEFAHRRKVDLCNFGDTSGTLWINGGSGIALWNGKSPGDCVDLEIEVEDDREQCAICGYYCEDLIWVESEDIAVCEDCYCDHFSTCEGCEEVYRSDDLHFLDDTCLCDSCYSENYAECEGCGEVHSRDDLCEGFCENCGRDTIAICEKCGEVYQIAEGLPDVCEHGKYNDTVGWYTDCAGRIMVHCSDCGKEIDHRDSHKDKDGHMFCAKCAQWIVVECAVCKIDRAARYTSCVDGLHYCAHCQPALFTTES